MKVALVLDRFDPSWGGLEAWVAQYAQWLVTDGHRPCVVAFVIEPAAVPAGVEVVPVKRPKDHARRAMALEAAARALAPDVLHDTGSIGRCDIYHPLGGSRLAARRAEAPARPLSDRWREFLAPRWRRLYRARRRVEEMAFADPRVTLIAVSHLVRDQFLKLHRANPSRIEVIHNGIDTARFSPLGRAADRTRLRANLSETEGIVFLGVAQNFALKGVDATLRAIAIICRNEPNAAFQYWLAGDGPIGRYRLKAERLGIADRVRFLGYVHDLRPLYHAADVMVHPALYDPCPLAALEALASGLPVITTPSNGSSELMDDGVDGLIVPNPTDAKALATAMRAHRTPLGWALIGSAASRRASRFHHAAQFSKIASLYERVAARRLGR